MLSQDSPPVAEWALGSWKKDLRTVFLSIGWRYNENPGTLSSPSTLGLRGSLRSTTKKGSTCMYVCMYVCVCVCFWSMFKCLGAWSMHTLPHATRPAACLTEGNHVPGGAAVAHRVDPFPRSDSPHRSQRLQLVIVHVQIVGRRRRVVPQVAHWHGDAQVAEVLIHGELADDDSWHVACSHHGWVPCGATTRRKCVW